MSGKSDNLMMYVRAGSCREYKSVKKAYLTISTKISSWQLATLIGSSGSTIIGDVGTTRECKNERVKRPLNH